VENGPKGLFKELVENLNVKNPTTFRLPEEIINFFEGGKILTKYICYTVINSSNSVF
jgi:hypothetical protein